jgi:hypothetical protein
MSLICFTFNLAMLYVCLFRPKEALLPPCIIIYQKEGPNFVKFRPYL